MSGPRSTHAAKNDDGSCREWAADLVLLAGGDLSSPEAEAVRTHVDRCEDCSRELAQHHWARRALQRAAPDADLDVGFFAGLQQSVMAQVQPGPQLVGAGLSVPMATASRSRQFGRPLAAAALFAVGLLIAQFGAPLGDTESVAGVDGTLTRPARAFPTAQIEVGARPTQPLGFVRDAAYHGLAGRQRAVELVDLDLLDDPIAELGLASPR